MLRLVVIALFCFTACGSDDDDSTGIDSGIATVDGGTVDSSRIDSAIMDAAAEDTGSDAAPDTGAAPIDASTDVMTEDSGPQDAALDAPTDTGGSSDGGRDAGSEQINCRPADVVCDQIPPTCEFGQAPSVVGDCYGPCVAIEMCPCSGPDDCPEPERYTCHNFASACGPYL